MNRLAHENSLYLKQHAENPVDWFPWGDDAWNKAVAEDKPVIISIGYSACHWCHVMAHESFEDPYIARLMNQHFVCIKIDREERPDVDRLYMEAVQMMQGHGGWPLNVFCLPDGRPFAGGTYFPPNEQRNPGIVPWPQLLMRVADFFSRSRKDLEENANAILHNMEAGNHPLGATGDPIEAQNLLSAAEAILTTHDTEHGGFGEAPKFPPAMTLDFLLALRGTAAVDIQRPQLATRIDRAINTTLTAMAHGGLYDQIGGGFARYSTDRYWIIPHFEKMLYDNAMLIDTYSRAWRRYPKSLYAAVVEETLLWLEREMKTGGGYKSSLDADTEGEEGLFYTWTPDEIESALGQPLADEFCRTYGISPEGNFENSGRSQPILPEPDFEIRSRLRSARATLLEVRSSRVPPGDDPKQLTAWNALLVQAMAEAAWTFDRADWMDAAVRLANWLHHQMQANNRLFAVAYNDQPSGSGLLDDYAATIQAYLRLAAYIDRWHPGSSQFWIQAAIELAHSVRRHFIDPTAVGFYFTADDHEALVHRQKEWYDNATPSGNSNLLHAFGSLYSITGDSIWSDEAERLKIAYPGIAERAPAAISHALRAVTDEASGIAVVKIGAKADIAALHQSVRTRPWRQAFFLISDEVPNPHSYQVCIGTQCLAPTSSPEEAAEQLS